MGATTQQPSHPSTHSTGSSPSSEVSQHSFQTGELQLHWTELGIPSAAAVPHAARPQALLSPSHSAMSYENVNVGQSLNSPYTDTPPTSLSDLPPTPYTMAFPSNGQSTSHQGHHRRIGIAPPSPQVLVPQSAPAHRMSSFPVTVPGTHLATSPSPPDIFSSPVDDSENLRKYIHELQMEINELRARNYQLEAQLQTAHTYMQPGNAGISIAGSSSLVLPTVPSIGQPLNQSSVEMEESWRKRTDARVRKFCSPNRAGNALCAWHDTRRERRAYPPRMAPQGTLNCGCTHEEALFEESLARHGVGSYLPGEHVRMDPSLRNPLLRLLQLRYGYRDGDFERDPQTGAWIENESHERWEAELLNHGSRHSGRR